uniref:Alliinase-like n=1 Tax=Allium cepa TaxID=4679 RepID=Q76BK3_ALLCE|nr:alliinase-like [Allium cepa]
MEYHLLGYEKPLLLITLLFVSSNLIKGGEAAGVGQNITLNSTAFPWRSWTWKAAKEAEAVAAINCSSHGRAFLDGIIADGAPMCERNNCYNGSDCSTLLPNCSADVVSGDSLFLEEYWMRHKSNTAVLISGWHRMSYYFAPGSFISVVLKRHIKLLHHAVGNAKTDGRYIVFGTGVTQLLNGLIISLSPNVTSDPKAPVKKVVAAVPYYPVFRRQTSFFNFKGYEWKGNASDYVKTTSPENFIELVTSPNNPEGRLRHSIIKGSSAIYDQVYYWPQYTAIKYASDENIMLFSMSKFTGHSGSRFGWAMIKEEKVYNKITEYMQQNSEGTSHETQLRTLKLIKEILLQIKTKRGTMGDINEFGYQALRKRWIELSKLVSSSNRFSLQKLAPEYCNYFKKIRDPSPSYGWLKCEWKEDTDCEAVLRNGQIKTQSGVLFEADSRYTRLSLIKTQDDFDQMIQKLKPLVHAKQKN